MSCTHQYIPSTHASYEKCDQCGTHHSLAAGDPAKLYIGSNYWSNENGRSSPDEQAWNCDVFVPDGGTQTKNEFVRERLEPPDFNTVIELGCAPGILLKQLADMFGTVVGIDADRHYEADIRRISGGGKIIIQFGLFPDCTRKGWKGDNWISCIIGLDIFEHSPTPQAFLMECYRLLKPGGQLFLMTPLASDDLPERLFTSSEHVFLHSRVHMEQLLRATGFRDATFDQWTPGHDTVSAWKV